MFAYDGGLGAVGVRRGLAVFVTKGGRAGGFAGGVGDGLFVVGDTGAGDGPFVAEGTGAGDDTSVAMLLDQEWNAIRNKKAVRFCCFFPAYLISRPFIR